MRYLIILSVVILSINICFAEETVTYEKISDTQFKKIEQVNETKETIYSLKELLEQKTHISEQIKRQKEELENAIKDAEKRLAEIEQLIKKAQELEIKE